MGCIIDKITDDDLRASTRDKSLVPRGNGGIIFMCGDDRLQPNPCRDCCIEADYLCDYPVGNDKTCDAKLCRDHAVEIAPNIYYCRKHYEEFNKFDSSGGVKKYLENVIPYPPDRRCK